MRHTKRPAALLLALLCLLSACGGGEDNGESGGKRLFDTVKVSKAYFGLAYYNNGPLNPVLDSTSTNRLVCEALYEGLFEVGENFTAQNVLCADYSGDGISFTFTIRDDVKFWSGESLTARDVVSSLQTARFNETSPFHNRLDEVSTIEALSDTELRITLVSPNINLPRLLDIPVFRAGTEGQDFADGTGPYCPVKEGSTWTLQANREWYGGFLGSIRHITLVSATRADAVESSFKTGDVSMIRAPRIAPEGESTMLGGSVDTVRTAGAGLHYLGINYERSSLANAKVRQAQSAALDRQSLCDTQLQTFAQPAVLPVNPQPTVGGQELDLGSDTARAIRLLKEAEEEGAFADDGDGEDWEDDNGEEDGGGGGDGDGGAPVSEPGQEPLLSLSLLVNEENSFKVAAAQQIAACWQAVGVAVTVDKQPQESFMDKVESGSFDIYYGETLMTPDFDLRPLLSSGGSLNYGGYSNEATARAISAARSGEDVTGLYQQLLSDMPLIPVAFECGQLILRKGLIDNFSPAPYNAFAGLEMWTSSS